jgi:prophage regulatory protein
MADKVLRKPAVEQMTGLDQVTLWRRERSGDFPRRIRLGSRAVGWLESEVQIWLEKRAAERPPPTNEHEAAKGSRAVSAAREKI